MVIGFDRTDDERKGSITYQTTRNLKDHFTATERTIYNMLVFLSVGVYPICFISCIVATSILFYKRHM